MRPEQGFIFISRTLLVPGWLLHLILPSLNFFREYSNYSHVSHTLLCTLSWNCLSLAAVLPIGTHLPKYFFFFLHPKVRKTSCIIYQHFLGGHTFHFSPLWPNPVAICSLKHPGTPVLDNTLQCYMQKNELLQKSEILSSSMVCPISCVLLVCICLLVSFLLLNFIPKKKF